MNWVSIGSGNGLAPNRHQAITRTNADLLSIGPLGTNFSENLIKVLTFSFKKMCLKLSSAKWRPFCPGEMSYLTTVPDQHPHWHTSDNLLYIPSNMHNSKTVLCFVLLWSYHHFLWINVVYLPISSRVTSLALGQSYDCPSATDVTLKDMVEVNQHQTPQQNTNRTCIIHGTYSTWLLCQTWALWCGVTYLVIAPELKHIVTCPVMHQICIPLTHCGLVTPYSDRNLGEHWLR